MPKKLPEVVKNNVEKCRSAAIAAVDAYNRPGPRFRTAQYLILITVAWTGLLHAIFFRRRVRPWYRRKSNGAGKGVRYQKIDGEPKHWDLAECVRQYFGGQNPPERKNLEFIIGLRNKIEHRFLPELDAALYGECQAALLNLEDLLVQEFGQRYGLAEQLAISLQFTQVMPEEKGKATRALAKSASRSVRDYVEKFRGNLDGPTLNSMKYSFSVFLVPKVANRQSAADVAVHFVRVDETKPEDLERLDKLNVLIREKHVPIANLGLYKPGEVVAEVRTRSQGRFNMALHTAAWKRHGVRPAKGQPDPNRTRSEYCVYDDAHEDYVYTKAWVDKLTGELKPVPE